MLNKREELVKVEGFLKFKIIEVFNPKNVVIICNRSNMLFEPTTDIQYVEEWEEQLQKQNKNYVMAEIETTVMPNFAARLTNGEDPKSKNYQESKQMKYAKGYVIFTNGDLEFPRDKKKEEVEISDEHIYC